MTLFKIFKQGNIFFHTNKQERNQITHSKSEVLGKTTTTTTTSEQTQNLKKAKNMYKHYTINRVSEDNRNRLYNK